MMSKKVMVFGIIIGLVVLNGALFFLMKGYTGGKSLLLSDTAMDRVVSPDLVVQATDAIYSGLDTVRWDTRSNAYAVSTYKPHFFVVENGVARLRLPTEPDQGIVSVLGGITRLNNRLYAHLFGEHMVLELDPTFTVVNQTVYRPSEQRLAGPDGFRSMWATASKNAVIVGVGQELIAFDPDLRELDRLVIDGTGPSLSALSQVGDRFYFAEGVDTGSASNCVSAPGSWPKTCGEQYMASGFIDASTPSDLKMVDFVKVTDRAPIMSVGIPAMKSYDPASQQWLFVTSKLQVTGSLPQFTAPDTFDPASPPKFPDISVLDSVLKLTQTIELRDATNIGRTKASLVVPEGTQVLGIASTGPFLALVKTGAEVRLLPIVSGPDVGTLTFDRSTGLVLDGALTSADIAPDQKATLKWDGNQLIVGLGEYLAVVDVAGGMRVVTSAHLPAPSPTPGSMSRIDDLLVAR